MAAGELHMWTVYDHPRDVPDAYVARRFTIAADGMPAADRLSFVAADLHPIRRMLEAAGLVRLPRDRDDDPVIMETWL